MDVTQELLKSIPIQAVTLLVGLLGFATAILTLTYSNINNKRNHIFLLEKDKRDRDDRQRKDELDFAKDKRDRQKSYNKVLGGFLKVYHSYLKHKFLFNEKGNSLIPDKHLIQMLDKIDNFQAEINSFKELVSIETEIIPELTIYLHEVLDILSRFEFLNSQIPIDPLQPETERIKVVFQRAHIFAVSELLDEYFSDLIDDIAKKAEVSKEFLDLIKKFNSNEAVEYNLEIQNKIMERMMQSLSRQMGQEIDLSSFL